jgi:hypothetical protein
MTTIQGRGSNNSRIRISISRLPFTIKIHPKISYSKGTQRAKPRPSKCTTAKSNTRKSTSRSSLTPSTSTSFSTLAARTNFHNNGRSAKKTNTEAPQCKSTPIPTPRRKGLTSSCIRPPSKRWRSCASRTIRITRARRAMATTESRI